MADVVKLNPVRRRFDFFQPEGVGRKVVEPRSPISGEVHPALTDRRVATPAFQAGLLRV